MTASAVAVAAAAKPTPAIPLAADPAAPPTVFKPEVTLLKAAFVLLTAVNSIFTFLFAMLPSIFQDF